MWNAIFAGIPIKRWMVYGGLLAGGVLFPIRVGVVAGESMDPTLRNGQRYLFTPHAYSGPISRGDVVVFEHDGSTYVKRVLAAAGESVYVLRYADTDELAPAWKLEQMRARGGGWRDYLKIVKITIPPGRMYVVGDHVSSSYDSRSFGPVSTASIRGKVLFAPAPRPDWTELATEPNAPHS